MSFIIKEKRVKEEIRTGVKCDICNKEDHTQTDPQDWHHFTHHHSDWGNDSCDSVEEFHVCSVECYRAQLYLSIKSVGEYNGAEIDEMHPAFAQKLCDALEGIKLI